MTGAHRLAARGVIRRKSGTWEAHWLCGCGHRVNNVHADPFVAEECVAAKYFHHCYTTTPAAACVAVRATSTQVVTVLAAASEPLELRDIADGVCAIRQGVDEAKGRGGTRYGEMCRTALARLIERGIVVRAPPEDKLGRMRFALAGRGKESCPSGYR